MLSDRTVNLAHDWQHLTVNLEPTYIQLPGAMRDPPRQLIPVNYFRQCLRNPNGLVLLSPPPGSPPSSLTSSLRPQCCRCPACRSFEDLESYGGRGSLSRSPAPLERPTARKTAGRRDASSRPW